MMSIVRNKNGMIIVTTRYGDPFRSRTQQFSLSAEGDSAFEPGLEESSDPPYSPYNLPSNIGRLLNIANLRNARLAPL